MLKINHLKPLLLSEAALHIWRNLRHANGAKVVVTNGCFDILHAQHVKHLQEAKALGDTLLVGIDSDARVRKLKGEGRPVNTAKDRAIVLLGLDVVDAVYIFDDESEGFLELARPDIWVKGGDYSIEKLRPQERDILERCGGEIVILPLHKGDSTSSIVKRIKLTGNNIVIPMEQEPNYVEPPHPWPKPGGHLHGGPDCDCHKNMPPVDPPPMREATEADREMLGLTIAQTGCPPGMVPKVTASTEITTTGTIVPGIISAPTLAEINPCKPDGDPLPEPKTPFDRLYNLVQNTPCPNYGPQMHYPGGLIGDWKPCGCCAVCKLKQAAKELYEGS